MDILVNSFQQDRRISLRYDVKTALRVQIWKSNIPMPQEISGVAPTKWRCTGRVVRVQPADSRKGKLGVGVRFDCYEILRAPPAAVLKPGVPHER
jgi:hypothetical protein